jgi:TolA-binding protein
LAARLLGHAGREAEAEAGLRRVLSLPWADADRRSDAWLELADLALAAGRTNDAVAAVDAAVRQARNRAAAWRCGLRGGGVLLRDPATLDTGAAMLKTAIRADPGRPEAARAQLALADACAAAGRFDRADDEYRIYLEAFADPAGTTTALRGRAWALLRRGRPGEAASVFQKAAESTTNPAARAECLFKAADALHADGRFAQAAHGYEAVADAADDPALAARARLMAADATDRGGDSAAAERLYLDVAARHAAAPEASEALLRVAMLRERRNAIDEAIDAYTRAMDATTNAGQRGRALIGRGRAQSRAYRFEAARADFARAETESPAAADEAAYLSALALYGLGRDDEADRACRAFLERYRTSPLRADATLWLARHQYNQGVYEDAQRLFLAYVAEWPGGGWADAALLWAGRAAFRRTAYAEAVEQLARLAREYPSSPRLAEGRFVQADALGELARFEEAILLLDEIVTRFPESEWAAQAWGRKGDCLFSLGAESPARYEEALKAYAMVTARPDVSAELALQAEFKAGRCLEKLQRTDAAIDQYYTRVVVRFLRERSEGVWHNEAAQTWFAKAAFQLADMLEARDDIEQAMRVLQRVVQADVAGREEARARIQRLQTESRWPL